MKNKNLFITVILACVILAALPGLSFLTDTSKQSGHSVFAQETNPTATAALSGQLLSAFGGNFQAQSIRPGILRSRPANINFNVLPPSSGELSGVSLDLLELNLFDDAIIMGQELRVDTNQLLAGSYVWIGTVVGDPYSQIILSVGNGLLEGFVSTGDRVYQITYDGARGQVVNQLVPSSIEPSGDDALIPPSRPAENSANSVGIQGLPGSNAIQNVYIVELMVVYTPAAATTQGGTVAMQNAIQAAVSAANQAYLNSDINLRLDLVHTEEISYTETGNMNTDLNRLTSVSDGFMDTVPTIRNVQGADLVSLITDQDSQATGICGLGWLFTPPLTTSFAPYGYNVVARDCLSGGRTLAHELGHNMGAAHNVENAGGQGAYPYSYGYYNAEGRFRDIMAYSNYCGFPCPTINYFSNTTHTINNRPMGNASANTALTLSNTSPVVSAFRGSAISVAPTATPMSGVVTAPSTPVPTAVSSTCNFTVTDANPAGLISAINSANSNGAGNDVICLAAGGKYTFASGPYGNASTYGNNALPLITSNITILGNGATLTRSGSALFRFFYVDLGATLSLDNVRLINGKAANISVFTSGGAIFNVGTTNIAKGYFADNISNNGGAVYNWGNLNIVDSFFTGNTAYYGGAVMAATGATISVINIQRSFFLENSAEAGSAIYSEGYGASLPSDVQVTVANSCFSSNSARSVDVSDDYPAQSITASNNWWNSSNGPGLFDGSVQAGDIVTTGEAVYTPFFTVMPNYCVIPAVFDGKAPAPNFFTVDTPTLTWMPSGSARLYEVQVSLATTFNPLAYSKNDVNPATPFITVPTVTLSDGLYYWRVRSCQGVNVGCGAWSATQTFFIKTH